MLDDDRTVRTLAENSIRTVWTRAGSESERNELSVIIRMNDAKTYKEVIARATKLIERAPWFAEAWYQRAVAQFASDRLVESIRDCHQTLEINPYHFVAATSMGQAYLELLNYVSALRMFPPRAAFESRSRRRPHPRCSPNANHRWKPLMPY